jgi:hypothetical protein
LIWKDGKPRTDANGIIGAVTIGTSVLLIEAGILILLLYFINKLFFYTIGENTNNKILIWTVRINIILSVGFIAFGIWNSFSQ